MKKEGLIIGALVLLLISVSIFSVLTYNKTVFLNSEINRLEDEKAQALNERDALMAENDNLKDKLLMLQQDVSEIYKGCINDNACKGHFPGVRWNCNNVGDEVDDPSHVCECDSSCNLIATEIKN